MASLYELNAEYSELQAMLEHVAETPEEEQAIVCALDSLMGNIEAKADGYARVKRNMEAEAEAIKAEEKRLAARRKALENGVGRLNRAIFDTMKLMGADKIATSIGSWSIKTNPPKVEVKDVSKIPVRFLIEQPPTVDKAGMLKEFKETGEIFDGVEITRGESLQFR